MAENNNALAGRLPKTPNPALKKLQPLVGKWTLTGKDVEGEVSFEWMEGGFFLIQQYDLMQGGEHHKGTEYTGFDEDTQTLRSRLMEIDGGNYSYTYDIEEDTLWYWFGDKGSDTFSKATFSDDGNSYTGRWYWPMPDGETGGYSFTATRMQ